MRIEDNRTDEKMEFGEIAIGHCFIFEGDYYIKIDVNVMYANAFNLTRNFIKSFNGHTKITPINAKVVIE